MSAILLLWYLHMIIKKMLDTEICYTMVGSQYISINFNTWAISEISGFDLLCSDIHRQGLELYGYALKVFIHPLVSQLLNTNGVPSTCHWQETVFLKEPSHSPWGHKPTAVVQYIGLSWGTKCCRKPEGTTSAVGHEEKLLRRGSQWTGIWKIWCSSAHWLQCASGAGLPGFKPVSTTSQLMSMAHALIDLFPVFPNYKMEIIVSYAV